ncbi:MAG: DUF488 domain-containing protein [Alphaproteobacteria bacterium]|nr:DUF488 domain-containing protein [Alphaproteobacteria bacterium]
MTAIFTIGHSNQTAEQFVGLLLQHGVQLLADVRSSPASRFAPQFNRVALARSLEQAGIEYLWFGQALGGKPRAPEPVFAAGISDLFQMAQKKFTAIMCAERDPRMCHRTHLVTPALLKNGAMVRHILGDGTLLAHDALQQPGKQPDLFG